MVAPALVFAGGVAVGAVVATNALRRRLARRRPRRVLVGLEVAESEGWRVLASNRGKDGTDGEDGVTRVGVFTNHTGVCPRTGRHIVDMLHALGSVDLRAVFAPEHGFRGEKQAGWCATGAEDETRDERTGAELIDAYRTRGDPAALAREIARHQLDCVVFDVQDVGARFYTYVSSLYDLLVAAARLNAARDEKAHDENARRRRRVRVVVLDRPNPLGGAVTEGPTSVETGFGSFVARVPMPIRHGMTVGELAVLFSRRFVGADPGLGDDPSSPDARVAEKKRLKKGLPARDVRVVKMRRWRREMAWEDTRLPWIPPSPNVPSPTSALAYVGTCLLEATNACEGRGTTTPFELVGAPWADARLAREMNDPRARPFSFANDATSRRNRGRGAPPRRRQTAPLLTKAERDGARGAFSSPACVWREAHFTPSWGKENDVPCVGAAAMFAVADDAVGVARRGSEAATRVVSRALFLEGVELLLALKKLYPRAFQWREGPADGSETSSGPTRPNAFRPDTSSSRVARGSARARVLASPTKKTFSSAPRMTSSTNGAHASPPFIDLLTGSAGIRLALDGATDPEQRRVAVERERGKWEKQLLAFEKTRRDALLY